MIFDLIACFYVSTGDKKPRYRVPMGTRCADGIDYFTEQGFVLCSFQDGIYVLVKDVDAGELLFSWQDDRKDASELCKVAFKRSYERIELTATGSMSMDDEYWRDWRVEIDDTVVSFVENAPRYPVIFSHGMESFTVELSSMLSYFKVDTMFEVMDRMLEFRNGDGWTYEELREYFTERMDGSTSADE